MIGEPEHSSIVKELIDAGVEWQPTEALQSAINIISSSKAVVQCRHRFDACQCATGYSHNSHVSGRLDVFASVLELLSIIWQRVPC